MWFTTLVTAILILPLALFAWAWIFYSKPPIAICMIADDKEKCLAVMEEVAESLGVEQVILYEAKGEDEYEHLGVFELQPEIEVEFDDEEDEDD